MHIKITNPAECDFDQIYTYIGKDNLSAAKKTIAHIFESMEYLIHHPNMGKTGRIKGTRELIVSSTPFIVIYQLKENFILILRILHSARKWP